MRGRRPTFTPAEAAKIRRAREVESLSLRDLRDRFGGAVPTLADVIYRRGAYQEEVEEIRRKISGYEAEIHTIKTIIEGERKKLAKFTYRA